MTFHEKIKELLESNGMFESQADKVIEKCKTDKLLGSLNGRWDDKIEGYPKMMVNAVWASVKHIALEWIDANMPLAWYRPMFVV